MWYLLRIWEIGIVFNSLCLPYKFLTECSGMFARQVSKVFFFFFFNVKCTLVCDISSMKYLAYQNKSCFLFLMASAFRIYCFLAPRISSMVVSSRLIRAMVLLSGALGPECQLHLGSCKKCRLLRLQLRPESESLGVSPAVCSNSPSRAYWSLRTPALN